MLSGASGLVFEVIWVRQLAAWVGHSTVAVSLVVAAFLAGLMLGSLVGARLADRGGALVRVYAALEAITAVAALAISTLLAQASPLSLWMADHGPPALSTLPARLALGFVVVLAPTVAMGATLPVLARAVTSDPQRAAAPLGALYSLNTLGAVAGCSLAGFSLLGTLGMVRTAALASACNVVVAALAWRLPLPDAPRSVSLDAAPARGFGALVAAAALTGFSAIACEVLWFRVLHSFVRSSTYAFTLLLAVYLAGLALGGALYARRFARRTDHWELLSDAQVAQAAAVLVSVALLGRTGTLASWLTARSSANDADLVHLAIGAVIILGPATLMGLSYPLVLAAGAHTTGRVGRGVGLLGAANTLGGVAGSLLAGLALVPALGTLRSFEIAVCATLAVAVFARSRMHGRVPWRGDAGRTARVALAVAVALACVPSDYLLRAVTTFPRARVLAAREGRDGTAAVLGYTRSDVCAASPNHCRGRCRDDFSYQQLIFGTVSYASTIPPAKRYMRALAHLPLLQIDTEDALDVAEVCFGTGTTAGAFTAHPSLGTLTIVDINRDVFEFARHFRASNRGVLDDPRVRLVVDDGRHHLETARQQWNVLSLEPPPPTAEGAATLYAREFYVAARRRLREGGVLAQWIPFDQQSEALGRAMLASITAEFAHVEVYLPSRSEGVVLASMRPLSPDLARWRSRWRGAVRESLAEVGFDRPERLLATRVLDDAAVRRWIDGAAPMVDDLPAVEFYRSHGGRPFRVATMLSLAPRPEASWALEARIERHGMEAWERSITGDLRGARVIASQLYADDGANPYTRYLDALEYDCLNLDAP